MPRETNVQSLRELLCNISDGLAKVKPTRLRVDKNSIEFSGGGIFRLVNKANILIPVSFGEITVEQSGSEFFVENVLKFKEILLLVTLVVFCFIGPLTMVNSKTILYQKFSQLGVCWLWLFGMNYMLTVFRFPSFIKRISKSQIPENRPINQTA